ncbi:sulfurtransferase/chromate resistance protein [bacterium]|nr:sulfurtransferase/chromate resistance protein [bacterium]
MPAFNEITPATLMRLIGTPQCPVIIDVCIDEDFNADPHLIPTSRRHSHKDLAALAHDLTGQSAVIICHKGKKLSHGTAAYLRTQGIDAQVLTGGNVAWIEAGFPRVSAAKIPQNLWVTRHRPKIDRIACPWLIKRFVDPKAQFLFVPPSEVLEIADRFGATPFDVEDVFWTHRGPQCTFDTMIAEFGLSHPALVTLATIVRAADTDSHNLAPQAAGLLALSVGMSRMHRDDLAQLEASLPIYDALYRWARDGQDEGHDWTPK